MISLSRLKEMVEEEMENKIKELEEKLLRKEQECEELKKELYYWVNGEYCDNKCNVVKELDQLKTENEELEKELRQKKMTILMNNDHYFEVGQENKKLKQTLAEIKEIAESEIDSKEFMAIQCMLNGSVDNKNKALKQILQKISECEGNNEYS